MIPREIWDELLALAAHAPSGDNAQPWKFVVYENSVDLYNIPGKDSSPYNFKERGSLFAHGAVIENLVLLLSAAGYAASISLFPEHDANCVARLTLSKKDIVKKEPLAAFIPFRKTNRKPYKKISLAAQDKEALLKIPQEFGFGDLHIIESAQAVSQLGKMLSLSDQLIFEDKNIHDAIFASIRWTKKDEEKRKGLYIKTLELPPPAQVIFKVMKNWSALMFLNKIKMSKFIASQSAKGYSASSAFGMITMPDDDRESFVKAGRVFQRLWLTATERGVDIQPVTALAYLAQRIHVGAALDLSIKHQEQILMAEKNVRTMFNANDGTIAMIFRMGYGQKPSAQSQKSIPEIVYA